MSGGWDGMVFVWDVRTDKPIKSLSGPKISGDSIDFKNDQILIASYNSEEALSIWDFKSMKKRFDI